MKISKTIKNFIFSGLLGIMIFAGIFVSAGNIFATTYQTPGTLESNNLLSGQGVASVDAFGYNAAIPANTSLTVQFSQNGQFWYSSAGVLNGSDTLSDGDHSLQANAISLSSLGWNQPYFIYKITFSSTDNTATPTLSGVSLFWTPGTNPPVYQTPGYLVSQNLLSGTNATSIDSFYTAATVPSGASLSMQFSQDNVNWYSATNVLNESTTVPDGATTTSLSALGWSGTSFYYKIIFTASSDKSATPTLTSATFNYTSSGNTNYYWYGGTGNWSDYANHWCTISDATCPSNKAANAPAAGDSVYFDSNSCGSACIVTIDSAGASVADLVSSSVNATISTASYGITVTGNLTVNKTISGTNAITLNGALKTITAGTGSAISSPVVLGGTRTINVETGTLTMSGIISDGGNAYGISKTGDSSTLTLSGANTFTGGLTIQNGTGSLTTSVNAAGTGTITLGSGTNSNAVTLKGDARTFANAIALANISTYTGTATISTTGNTTFSGAVTGTNNLTLTTASSNTLALSNASINNTGTITNTGAGTGTTTISGIIGTSVTGIIQNSSTSALTLSGNNSTVGAVTITAGTLALATTTNLNVKGNFSKSGTFTPNSSTVTFTSGTHHITGANTFYNLAINANNTVTFPASTTQTISNSSGFTCAGTSGNSITINSSLAGTQATLSMAGTANCDYLSLRDSNVTGGATWNAGTHSTNISDNTGWTGLGATSNLIFQIKGGFKAKGAVKVK